MKSLRKIMAFLIAMTMVLGMSISVFAAPKDVSLEVDAVEGHKYSSYQLLVGDLAEDGKTLSNVKWGANVADSITYNETTITPVAGDKVPEAFLTYLSELQSDTQQTADIISAWVKGDGTDIPAAGLTVKTGYYVITDAYTDSQAEQTTTISTIMCQVVGPTTVTPKAGTTSHKKEVLDINDSKDVALNLNDLQGVDEGWDKSADHDFDDHVPFKLTTTIGSDFAKYNSYYLAVNDTLKDGLVLDQDSIMVYVDGVLATAGTEAGQYSLTKDTKTFKVEFTKLNGNTNAAADKEVVVYYTATLDAATAVIGSSGNWNESYAEFSNNPNGNQEGKGTTPKDTAVVFTYKTDVDKVDKDLKPLAGAQFTLTKKLADGTTKPISVITLDEAGTQFSFKGLDDGIYTLTETVTPDGYNTIDPVTFQIVATHSENGISVLDVKNEDGSEFTGNLEFTKVAGEGTLSTRVVNNQGSTLPSTGGIGTTIFYVIGGILVAGAAIILIAKKRVNG